MEQSRGWNWNWNWHRAANQSPRPEAASSATASGRSKNVCPASSAAGGQTNTRSGIQSGCQITIMVFIHKFISLFKHASEFTDTINNARPTNAMGNPAAPSFVFLSSFFSLFPLMSLAFGAAAGHRRRAATDRLGLVLGVPWSTGNGSHSLPSTKFEVHCAVILTIMLMSIGYRDASIEHRASTTRAMIHQNSRHGNAICVIYADCLTAWVACLPGCPVSSAHTVICSISRAIRQIQNADYQMWRLHRSGGTCLAAQLGSAHFDL